MNIISKCTNSCCLNKVVISFYHFFSSSSTGGCVDVGSGLVCCFVMLCFVLRNVTTTMIVTITMTTMMAANITGSPIMIQLLRADSTGAPAATHNIIIQY